MSETKWTPGPWRVCYRHRMRLHVVGADDGRVASLWMRNTTTEPNAHLIAAAPTMAEALADAHDFFAHYASMNEPAQDEMADEKTAMLERMRAALALARGEPEPGRRGE